MPYKVLLWLALLASTCARLHDEPTVVQADSSERNLQTNTTNECTTALGRDGLFIKRGLFNKCFDSCQANGFIQDLKLSLGWEEGECNVTCSAVSDCTTDDGEEGSYVNTRVSIGSWVSSGLSYRFCLDRCIAKDNIKVLLTYTGWECGNCTQVSPPPPNVTRV
jgi:hypothetical protein